MDDLILFSLGFFVLGIVWVFVGIWASLCTARVWPWFCYQTENSDFFSLCAIAAGPFTLVGKYFYLWFYDD
jgi:hypothetical protein